MCSITYLFRVKQSLWFSFSTRSPKERFIPFHRFLCPTPINAVHRIEESSKKLQNNGIQQPALSTCKPMSKRSFSIKRRGKTWLRANISEGLATLSEQSAFHVFYRYFGILTNHLKNIYLFFILFFML